MSHIRGVLFDLDGTIAETHPMAVELIGGAIVDHGGPGLTPEEVVGLFGPDERGILRSVLGPSWGEAWRTYLRDYQIRHHACPDPFPGVSDLIRRLRGAGARIGVVTGKTDTTARISLELYGLLDLFETVAGGSMVGVVKASRIEEIVRNWRLTPSSVCYLGDDPLDVREARKAGVRPLAAAWSAFSDRDALSAEAPEVIFDTVPEATEWLLERVSGVSG